MQQPLDEGLCAGPSDARSSLVKLERGDTDGDGLFTEPFNIAGLASFVTIDAEIEAFLAGCFSV